jgi:PiT family inorganic phosphate transporter
MVSALALLVLVVVLALAFDYINGFHDTANAVATVVSTNVLPGRTAVLLAALFNFVGAFLSTGVAKTIGGDIARPETITQTVVAAALLGAILWNLLTWYLGIPSSSSHALIGGIVGAAWAHQVALSAPPAAALGDLVTSDGVTLALKGLVLSPLLGLACGFVLMVLLLWLVRRWRPGTVNRTFRVAQLCSAGFMAFAHGSNDAQKSMGIITMALVSYAALHGAGAPAELRVPWWVIVACATAMALGTASGAGGS